VIGPIIRLIRGVHATVTFPNRIEKLRQELDCPLEDEYSGVERFDRSMLLNDAQLLYEIEKNPSEFHVHVQAWEVKAYKEFEMAESELKNETANRAEVSRLAIALKSFGFHIKDNFEKTNAQLETQFSKLEEENKNYINNEIDRRTAEIYNHISFWIRISIGLSILSLIGVGVLIGAILSS
jgi:hypothetical protein